VFMCASSCLTQQVRARAQAQEEEYSPGAQYIVHVPRAPALHRMVDAEGRAVYTTDIRPAVARGRTRLRGPRANQLRAAKDRVLRNRQVSARCQMLHLHIYVATRREVVGLECAPRAGFRPLFHPPAFCAHVSLPLRAASLPAHAATAAACLRLRLNPVCGCVRG
jgi:hypothetical protein